MSLLTKRDPGCPNFPIGGNTPRDSYQSANFERRCDVMRRFVSLASKCATNMPQQNFWTSRMKIQPLAHFEPMTWVWE